MTTRQIPGPQMGVPEDEQEREPGVLQGLIEIVQALAIAVLISIGLNLFVVQVTEVRQRSMEPTLEHGDRVLVSKLDYRFAPPARCDIIVFRPPIDAGIPFVKRVVAVAGDVVDLREGRALVNGEEACGGGGGGGGSTLPRSRDITYPVTVPANAVWVLGDNRAVSGDSREWGAVPEDDIIGKVVVRFWPPQAAAIFGLGR